MNTKLKLHKSSPWIVCTFLFTLSCLPISGCESATKTIWSAQSKSPDGGWLALAHTENTAGPGVNAQYTIVEMRQNFKTSKPVQILVFDEDHAKVKILSMTWVSPSHLNVSYSGDATLLFQAIKAFGNDITTQHIPN